MASTSNDKKRKTTSSQEVEVEEGPAKRPRDVSTTDVVVVVGGTPFHENSHFLRAWSGYFDAAFRNGMKESQTKRFEFPDRDPDEWELVKAVLDPFDDDAKLDLHNSPIVLPWFVLLAVPRGIDECDKVYQRCVGDRIVNKNKLELLSDGYISRRVGCILLVVLPRCLEHNLPRSKDLCFRSLRNLLRHPKKQCVFRKDDLQLICDLVEKYEECRAALWPTLERFLPKPVPDRAHQDALLATEVLPQLISDKITAISKKVVAKQLAKTTLMRVKKRVLAAALSDSSSSVDFEFGSDSDQQLVDYNSDSDSSGVLLGQAFVNFDRNDDSDTSDSSSSAGGSDDDDDDDDSDSSSDSSDGSD